MAKPKDPFLKQEGDLLRKARTSVNMSQKEFCEKLGYSTGQYLSNIERGYSRLPIGKFPDVAKIFGRKVGLALADIRLKSHRKMLLAAFQPKGRK